MFVLTKQFVQPIDLLSLSTYASVLIFESLPKFDIRAISSQIVLDPAVSLTLVLTHSFELKQVPALKQATPPLVQSCL